MADKNSDSAKSVYSANDPIEINELMSLNNDISNDFIEQLQNQISGNNNDDSALFEEPDNSVSNAEYEDPFMRKFNEKKRKRMEGALAKEETPSPSEADTTANAEPITEETKNPAEEKEETAKIEEAEKINNTMEAEISANETSVPDSVNESNTQTEDIDVVTGGNITEKPLNKTDSEYSESLDYLDNNVKYSKYVIYIDPENKEFIDSLTVKERKNLINRILREQDSIAITRNKLKNMHSIIAHILIAIVTVVISIPIIYFMINASLEATINNYKNSQTTFGQLYKAHSKIKPVNMK